MERKSSRRAALRDITLQAAPASQKQANALPLSTAESIHAGLWLDKYITNLDHEDTGVRRQLVADVASIPVPEIYESFYANWLASLNDAQIKAKTREYSVKGRMVVGLGNEGVLETSITLHRTYGVPYIPGSALKGLAASYARLMAGDDWQPGGLAYQTVFGDTNSAGFVTFFDALYIPIKARQASSAPVDSSSDCPLCADIITVHHPHYYRGKQDSPPADWDSPTPIPFLSATGSYLIALAAPDLADVWIEKVFDLLTQALLILGIGAKTSSGYGRMEHVSPFSPEAQQIMDDIEKMAYVKINAEIQQFYERWGEFTRRQDRLGIAQTIIHKVRANNYEPKKIKLAWYQELITFVDQISKGKEA